MEVDGEGTVPSDSDNNTDSESEGDDSSAESSVSGVEGVGSEEVDPIFRADVRRALGAAGMDSDSEVGSVFGEKELRKLKYSNVCVCRVEVVWTMRSWLQLTMILLKCSGLDLHSNIKRKSKKVSLRKRSKKLKLLFR